MPFPLFLTLVACMVFFFIIPQLAKFRATLGIDRALVSNTNSFWRKARLSIIGLRTPFINTIAICWSFILAEGDSLRGFAWETILSHEQAAWIAFGLWAASLWAHFSGLNAAAATPPIATQLPSSLPIPSSTRL